MAADAVLLLVRDGAEVTVGRLHCESCDLGTVDALARLQLVAKSLGCSLRLRGAPEHLRVLLDFVGIGSLLGEPGRQPEGLEEIGVEEVVDLDDPSV